MGLPVPSSTETTIDPSWPSVSKRIEQSTLLYQAFIGPNVPDLGLGGGGNVISLTSISSSLGGGGVCPYDMEVIINKVENKVSFNIIFGSKIFAKVSPNATYNTQTS